MQKLEQLIELIENYVEIDEIKAEDNFKFDLGMSSFDTVCLAEDIKTAFGVTLTAADFIKHKTVGAMAEHLQTVGNIK